MRGVLPELLPGGAGALCDDDYPKLVVVSNWETRQTEFDLERESPSGGARGGSSVAGPPGEEWTWLSLAVCREAECGHMAGYKSGDDETWVRSETWTRGSGQTRIGLVSMEAGDIMAQFDGLRVFRLDR